MTLGQEFKAYATAIGRDLKHLELAIDALSEINMGATAIGTGIMNKLPSSTRFEKAPAGTFGGSASSIFLNPYKLFSSSFIWLYK